MPLPGDDCAFTRIVSVGIGGRSTRPRPGQPGGVESARRQFAPDAPELPIVGPQRGSVDGRSDDR
ncbi:hypothetical protein Rhow_008043 [Rhodococcus wratislaviensis]|uniref:Uncharacterized protein n=1 Tax=Rhodococcus wratislaviensis TaxID=44752 RepID=A0A402CJN0_RHOWR|nr:hypothetical protein Rhow_008043 [Rhodococcus wratislaviensis]